MVVTKEQLEQAESLEGATMPDGQTYEEWLKTLEGQDWLRKHKKEAGEYESCIQTTEGQM
jgi:hypothetical protein